MGEEYLRAIAPHRRAIDEANEEILQALARRVEAARAIGAIKEAYGVPVRDVDREAAILEWVGGRARMLGLNPGGVQRVFRSVIELCVEEQTR